VTREVARLLPEKAEGNSRKLTRRENPLWGNRVRLDTVGQSGREHKTDRGRVDAYTLEQVAVTGGPSTGRRNPGEVNHLGSSASRRKKI